MRPKLERSHRQKYWQKVGYCVEDYIFRHTAQNAVPCDGILNGLLKRVHEILENVRFFNFIYLRAFLDWFSLNSFRLFKN